MLTLLLLTEARSPRWFSRSAICGMCLVTKAISAQEKDLVPKITSTKALVFGSAEWSSYVNVRGRDGSGSLVYTPAKPS